MAKAGSITGNVDAFVNIRKAAQATYDKAKGDLDDAYATREAANDYIKANRDVVENLARGLRAFDGPRARSASGNVAPTAATPKRGPGRPRKARPASDEEGVGEEG